MTAGWQKIFHPDPKIGFLAGADALSRELAGVGVARVAEVQTRIFNLRLDAFVTGLFMALVALIVLEAARAWYRELRRPEPAAALRALGGR